MEPTKVAEKKIIYAFEAFFCTVTTEIWKKIKIIKIIKTKKVDLFIFKKKVDEKNYHLILKNIMSSIFAQN